MRIVYYSSVENKKITLRCLHVTGFLLKNMPCRKNLTPRRVIRLRYFYRKESLFTVRWTLIFKILNHIYKFLFFICLLLFLTFVEIEAWVKLGFRYLMHINNTTLWSCKIIGEHILYFTVNPKAGGSSVALIVVICDVTVFEVFLEGISPKLTALAILSLSSFLDVCNFTPDLMELHKSNVPIKTPVWCMY